MSQSEPATKITLPDGRSLSYLVAGADSGPVVTVLDGPCSRGLGRGLASTARELGIRLVIPDRPGCHDSTPKPGRTVADWPSDHLALMDELGVARFGIITQSGGTPYGIAVAAAAPERVSAQSLLGAIAPLAEKAQWRAAGRDMKVAAILSRRAPFLLRAGFKRQYKTLPDSALGLLKGPDAEVVKTPWVRELFVRTTAEVFANPDGFIEEVRILCKPWGITPGAVPASLWTGEFDPMHPPSHARRVAEILGGDPRVIVVPGVAQIGLLAIFEEALR
ncbi:MAG TPA: alpha/beta hydrolase, partial [Solirubrobacteraceae bacterium]|nr:alpha/beta hydrolase [Solirubrobacteraceae bacterium]